MQIDAKMSKKREKFLKDDEIIEYFQYLENKDSDDDSFFVSSDNNSENDEVSYNIINHNMYLQFCKKFFYLMNF